MFRQTIGCIGWTLMVTGLWLLLNHWFGFSWGVPMLYAAALLIIGSYKGHPVLRLLAPISLTAAVLMLGRDYGLIAYSPWRFWPVMYGSAGVGLALLWATSAARAWILIPAGLLLLVCGFGIGSPNIMAYRYYTEQLYHLWPVGLVVAGGWLIYRIKWKKQNTY